jgi:hypothetical protein
MFGCLTVICIGRVWGRPEFFGADQAGAPAKSDVDWQIEERSNTGLCHHSFPDAPPGINFLPC